MKQRMLPALLALVLALCLAACSQAPAAEPTTAPDATQQAPQPSEAPAPSESAQSEAPAAPVRNKQAAGQVIETGVGVQVIPAAQWQANYPDVFASYLRNSENSHFEDHTEEYPMIKVLYEGMAFSQYYNSARGHTYTIEDVVNIGRPHPLANCFTCKTPDFTAAVNNEGPAAYSIPFDEMLQRVVEPISCYNCHGNSPGELFVTHTYLSDALGGDLASVKPQTLACAQCHVEYHFAGEYKAVTLPYDGLTAMHPDSILSYYNNELILDGKPFADYENPRTGVRQIKVQHPEFETYMGAGSVHANTFTCADCHMGDAVSDGGDPYVSHYWISPLEIESLSGPDGTCTACHGDLGAHVKGIQDAAEERTISIGNALEQLTEQLAAAVQSGDYTDEQLDAIRAVARDAQFYWDFVFVENSEGAHNSKLTNECLDKSEALLNEALALFK